MKLVRRTLDQIDSPISEAFALVPQRTSERRLLDLSQAAPSYPAPDPIIKRIAEVAASPDGSRYAPSYGLPGLRETFAAELSSAYEGDVRSDQVLITAGCNQAFTIVTSALAEPGDRVILPVPHYFNHDMWLRLDNLGVDHLMTGEGYIPDVAAAEALVTDRTRAIVLVTPGNPTGAIIGPEVIADFAELARRRDLVLILDETYRSFRPTSAPAHGEFGRAGWDDHVVSLHSFSKEFAIPGYRVGAAVGHPDLLAQALKLFDCVAICAPRIGQEAAIAGLSHATEWRQEQVERTAQLQQQFTDMFATKPGGWELYSAGAYFGWVRHPFDEPTGDVIRKLVFDHDVLAIPGTGFTPTDERFIRMSFANLDPDDIDLLAERLAETGTST